MPSLPAAFVRQMQSLLGADYEAFEESLTADSPVSVRVNDQKKSALKRSDHVPWTRFGHYLHERPVFTLDPLFHAGGYYVQEASSMFLETVWQQLVPDKAINVLDLCAAPGGKSTHLLSLLPGDGLLVSNEVIRSRAGVLSENIQKWGRANAVVTSNDPEDFAALTGFFDVVLVDAPCSGEGLFRKDPAAMTEWSPAAVELCAGRQRRILASVWPALREGGLVIYGTCTYNTRENDDNVQWLQETFGAEPCPLALNPQWNIVPAAGTRGSGYRLFPHRVKGEGLFMAALRKPDSETPSRSARGKGAFGSPSRKIVDTLQQWLRKDTYAFIQRGDMLQFFPVGRTEDLWLLASRLRIVHAGVFAGQLKGDKIVPDHALALSIDLNREALEEIHLSEEQVLQYLRRESLPVGTEKKGYALVTYDDVPVGWVNRLGNRLNNMYPQAWRIRM